MKPIELDELGPGVERLLTPEQGRSLAGSGVVTAAPSLYSPGIWQISPAGKVGAARVGGIEIHIKPKVPVPLVDAESQRMLRRLLRDFRDFRDVTPLHRGDQIPDWQATRLNGRYHAALRLAELVLRATSVEHGFGTVAVNGFLLDMPRLFEDIVTVALREALISAYGGHVDDQDQNHFDEAGQVHLRPDIVWKIGGSAVAVIDAKYKAEKPAGYPNANLYQLLAYCTILGLRSGRLVYARGNEDPAHHVVRRSAIEIFCHAVDLEQPPGRLLVQMSDLSERIAATRLQPSALSKSLDGVYDS